MLASVEQVLAYFLPEAPTEMLMNFDEVREYIIMVYSYNQKNLELECSEEKWIKKKKNILCKVKMMVTSILLLSRNIFYINKDNKCH